jgi:hypothetical protein
LTGTGTGTEKKPFCRSLVHAPISVLKTILENNGIRSDAVPVKNAENHNPSFYEDR